MGLHEDAVREFLVEARELLDQMDRDLVALEKKAEGREIVDRIFRAVHTIKGVCGFLGYPRLEALTHAGENLLSLLREGRLAMSREVVTALLGLADGARGALDRIGRDGQEGAPDHAALRAELDRLASGGGATAQTAEAAAEEAVRSVSAAETSIRVDVGVLDRLMDQVGELVLARNQILQAATAQQNPVLAASSQKLDHIVGDLQEAVMKTRMQPISTVWGKMPRLVRDLAIGCGKEVRLDMEGAETELDRSLLEAVKDPMLHIVRNAVDHGIEAPDRRAAAGKAREGRLRLRAYHEGGQVVIEFEDDGAGIDPAKVRAKAVERGLLSEERASRLNERETIDLIFLPGFSTAAAVTSISGRGVGMDVVKTNVERIGGTIDLQSRPGAGTTLRLRIPLTLAIVPGLVVGSGGQRYAVPQSSLVELVRVDASARASIESVEGTPVYRLRGRLLPLVHLDRVLSPGAAAPEREGTVNIVVLEAEQRQFGLVVDKVFDNQEIVVKPLGRRLKGIGIFAGATIMGDGRVALILDVAGLARRAQVVSEAAQAERAEAAEEAAPQAAEKTLTLLVFAAADGGRMAVPLDAVARLEEFERAAVERAGDQEVVQYRDRILRLIDVAASLPERRRETRGEAAQEARVPVVVYSRADKSVGLRVGSILDISEAGLAVKRPSSREGVLFCVVVNERVTEVLDVEAIIRRHEPDFFAP